MSDASMSEEDVAHIFGTSPRAGAWQPIETAPKDGSDVLVFKAYSSMNNGPVDSFYIQIGHWNDDDWWISAFVPPINNSPTHWMPLPAPPSTYQEWD